MKKRVLLLAVGVAMVAALSGCASVATVFPRAGGNVTAQAAPPSGFAETDSVDALQARLEVQPFKPGENRFEVLTAESGIAAVECQVIMLEMGHGLILDLSQVAPGRWATTSPVIDMEGKWMMRVKLTLNDGTEKLLPFYGKVKPEEPQ